MERGKESVLMLVRKDERKASGTSKPILVLRKSYSRTKNHSTDHLIQSSSKEYEHTNFEFCGTGIPSRNGKKFPKHSLQPT
jgi:hypothetical protein